MIEREDALSDLPPRPMMNEEERERILESGEEVK